jgi:hypothetical protein
MNVDGLKNAISYSENNKRKAKRFSFAWQADLENFA